MNWNIHYPGVRTESKAQRCPGGMAGLCPDRQWSLTIFVDIRPASSPITSHLIWDTYELQMRWGSAATYRMRIKYRVVNFDFDKGRERDRPPCHALFKFHLWKRSSNRKCKKCACIFFDLICWKLRQSLICNLRQKENSLALVISLRRNSILGKGSNWIEENEAVLLSLWVRFVYLARICSQTLFVLLVALTAGSV